MRPDIISKNEYVHVASVLLAARKEARLSPRALGERLDVGQKIISVIELGNRRVDFLELCAFERELGLPPLELAKRILAAQSA